MNQGFDASSSQASEPALRYEALIDYLAARQAEEEFSPDRCLNRPPQCQCIRVSAVRCDETTEAAFGTWRVAPVRLSRL